MLTPTDLVSEFSVRVYEPPLSELRDRGEIADLSKPISVVMLLIDFETEVSMNGIVDGFIGNSSGIYASETVAALRVVGCEAQAELLSQILQIAAQHGLTHAVIQSERNSLEPYQVSTFRRTHGDKWDTATAAIGRIEHTIDFDAIYTALETFIQQHRASLEPLLSRS